MRGSFLRIIMRGWRRRIGFEGDCRRLGSLAAGAGAGGGWRGYDCGPERSLRTSPVSTSYAFGSLRFPSGASTRPAIPRLPRPPLMMRLSGGRGASCLLGVFCQRSGGGEGLARSPKAAARAAFFGVGVFGVGGMTLRAGDGAALRLRCDGLACLPRLHGVDAPALLASDGLWRRGMRAAAEPPRLRSGQPGRPVSRQGLNSPVAGSRRNRTPVATPK
ncbi:Uncharacterised protein [Achromobacter xylosoxidans]|nr:Uncharacterised protein [Achromobacter xylosoxidans]